MNLFKTNNIEIVELSQYQFGFVTFGTARRGLGGLQPRPVPSSLYQT